MKSNPEFISAINIYKQLLEKGFPQKAILKLVGDRYRLGTIERTMLYRGICTDKDALLRKSKLTFIKEIKNKTIHIDGYNIFITIGSYLNGSPVFIGNDNFLRDASEIHGKIFKTELITRAIELTFIYLKRYKVSGLKFYLDQPVSNSGKLSVMLNKNIKRFKFAGISKTLPSPDFALKQIKQGIIATSDSSIIENCNVPVFDLARRVLYYNFKPDFYRLG
jgi:hypothetical protein